MLNLKEQQLILISNLINRVKTSKNKVLKIKLIIIRSFSYKTELPV